MFSRGWNVTLITFASVESDFYKLPAGITRVGLNRLGKSHSLWGAFSGNWNRIRDLRREVQRTGTGIVVSFVATCNIVMLFATLGLSVATIVSERSAPQWNIGRIWALLRKLIYRRADAIVVQTEQAAEWIRSITRHNRIVHIPNPVSSPGNLTPAIPAAFPSSGKKIILSVGRLHPVKGYANLIAAFALISETCFDWDLIILGEGQQRPELEGLVRKCGLGDRVFLPGKVSNPGDWMERADLYVSSSVTEGFPNALCEAMARGLPVISTDCPVGPREIIRHGVDGLLVPPQDDLALAGAIRSLIDNPQSRLALAKRAREVLKRFDAEVILSKWEALFKTFVPAEVRV
jgi:GalNAc-alpha-(1->4)-GalNAc-alpha-(1->3)-diNAcBac-PP-undecaprenol alpha-1,4-N-acetyl-D-galactosaminyltransferase